MGRTGIPINWGGNPIQKAAKALEAMGDIRVQWINDHSFKYDGCTYTMDRGGNVTVSDPLAAGRIQRKR